MKDTCINQATYDKIETFMRSVDTEFDVRHHLEIQDDYEFLLIQIFIDEDRSIADTRKIRNSVRNFVESCTPQRSEKPMWSIGIEANGETVDAIFGGQTSS